MPHVPLFWLIVLLLVAATLAVLVWPLLRTRAVGPSEPDDAASTDVYRDQKRQLDAELTAGAITPAERDAGLNELAARLGAELETGPGHAPATHRSPRSSLIAALVLVALLPATAMLLYATFGDPAALRVVAKTDERAPMTREQVVAMVESLAARMKQHPEDPTGWKLLARAYSAMGRYPESVAAFKEAATRSPQEDPSLLADWADALAMQDRSLQGEPSRLVSRALTLDPNHPKALALAASAALERKDYDGAIAQWRKLQAQFPPGSEEVTEIGAMIAEADAAIRGAPAAPVAANAVPFGAEGGAIPADAGAPPVAAEAAAITGRVSLEPALRERAAPGDTLFIYARAADGPRMPVAILRKSANTLPLEFRLDDSLAMTPAARLSTSGAVVVEARISKSGTAAPAAGDLHGASGPVKPGARDVDIVINDVVR